MRKKATPSLFAIYLGLLFFVSWWPFRFHLRSDLAAHFEWPLFKLLSPEYWNGGKGDTLKIVTFVPLGVLIALTANLQVKGRIVLWRAFVAGVGINLLIQFGWLFLPGRSISASDLALNVIGTLAGASPACFHYLSRRTLALLTSGYGACFLVAATWPWNFSKSAAAMPALLHRIEWIPFEDGFLKMWALKEGALNTLMTVPLGLLAASFILRRNGGRRAVATATVLGLACSTLVEGLQCFLPSRTPSLSDISLNTLGALIGGALAYYFERWHRREHPELKTSEREAVSAK